jgi:cytochrome c biogenesis protein CcmG, thiol:disulfide interchange protein DsbE
MTTIMDSPEPGLGRRKLLLGALASVGVGVGAAGARHVWRRKDLGARFFNPLSFDHFDLPGIPELKNANGAPVPGFSAADLRGKRAIVNVWASWCPHCREEHPHLVALAARRIAPIFGADVKDPPARSVAFLTRHGNPYDAVGMDAHAYFQFLMTPHMIPATFIVGPGPTVEWTHTGPLTPEVIEGEIVPRFSGGVKS